ncbi:MAG: ATP-dependent DNA helicase RecG [Parcubacteria group bacterium]
MKFTLATEIRSLSGVGPKLEKRFSKLGIRTIQQLLAHYPKRYDDFRTTIPIVRVSPGSRVHIQAKVDLIDNRRSPRRRLMITEALLSDETGSIKAVWFNQPFITKQLVPGDVAYFAGKAESDQYGFQLMSPTFEKRKYEQTHTGRIVPVYGLTEDLTAKQIRYAVKLVLSAAKTILDWLPQSVLMKYNLLPLNEAVTNIHFPSSAQNLLEAQRRLKFNELFLIQLRAAITREELKKEPAPPIPFNEEITKRFTGSLPFALTNAQKKSSWEILRDIGKKRPMNRLLEGDVGSGKTVVAAIAIINATRAGYQSAFMSPTEILAEQHFKTLTKLFEKESIRVALLTGSVAKMNRQSHVTRKQLKESAATGKIDVIIGTHALIQESVSFHQLGLVIVDEQHRFGVQQRKKLVRKAVASQTRNTQSITPSNLLPHLLSMTATPIPRSLALTVYGDLDLSIIDEMPKGRKEIITKIITPHKRQDTYDFIRQEIRSGRQAFVVCPLIDPSDKLGVKSVKQEAERLDKEVFPDLRIGMLHGKLGTQRKERVMRDLLEKKIDILCATAVVEVGIDIPNASVMMIEGAERFGLAQLHQFRGRVGRAEHQSYCFLFSETESQSSIDRLHALVASKNGFELAEKDLEFRGPGDMYGSRQTGLPPLKIASLTDYQIIKESREAVTVLMGEDPQLTPWPLVKRKAEQFERSLHLE